MRCTLEFDLNSVNSVHRRFKPIYLYINVLRIVNLFNVTFCVTCTTRVQQKYPTLSVRVLLL
jgi:hypothetical protein